MLKNILFFIALFYGGGLIAQTAPTVSCTNGQYVFHAGWSPTKRVIVYAVRDTQATYPYDLADSNFGWNLKACQCNDTMATFYAEDIPVLYVFKKEAERWQHDKIVTLPPTFPMVGTLQEGKEYKRYKHTLVAPDRVVSQLTVLKATDRGLIPLEQYEIEYKILAKEIDAAQLSTDTFVVSLTPTPKTYLQEVKKIRKE